MKRFFLLMSFVIFSMGLVIAEDYAYPYLLLKNTDGTKTAVAVNQLEITFSNGQLVAKNADGTQTAMLTDLATMEFSGTTTGIEQAPVESAAPVEAVYDLSGRRAYKSQGQLRQGTYIVRRTDGSTSKIVVK